MELTCPARAQLVAAASGTYSQVFPGAGDGKSLYIPPGVTVTVDGKFTDKIDWLRVDGTLRFLPDRDTLLTVETIVVGESGTLEVGTEAQPVTAKAVILIADRGQLDTDRDPIQISRGLISMGSLSLVGAPKSSYVLASRNPRRGDAQLLLAEQPVNWRPGDQVLVPGTRQPSRMSAKQTRALNGHDPEFQNQHETFPIAAVSGTTVSLPSSVQGLYHHQLPPGMTLPIGNLTRHVEIRSENMTDRLHRGHVMVMHGSSQVNIKNVGFHGLGRTHSEDLITVPGFDSNGVLIPGTDENVSGRYSLHFHRVGTGLPAVVVSGLAITKGLKWGVVNHRGNLVVEDSVSFDVAGAHFSTEAGDEQGAYRRNLAVKSDGQGWGLSSPRLAGFNGTDLRQRFEPYASMRRDRGWGGVGFWNEAPGVLIEDNYSFGHRRELYAYWLGGFTDVPGEGVVGYPLEYLTPELRDILRYDRRGRPIAKADVSQVPFTFRGNVGAGAQEGLTVYIHAHPWPVYASLRSLVADSVLLNSESSVKLYGASRITFDGVMTYNHPEFFANGSTKSNIAYTRYSHSGDIVWRNVHIENMGTGIGGFSRVNRIEGDRTLIRTSHNGVATTNSRQYEVHLNPDQIQPISRDLYAAAFGKRVEFYINGYIPLQLNLNNKNLYNGGQKPAMMFQIPGQEPMYLYYRPQLQSYLLGTQNDAESSRLFGALSSRHPGEDLSALTSLEYAVKYRLAIGGALAPADARLMPELTNGVVSAIKQEIPAGEDNIPEDEDEEEEDE